MDGLLTGLVWKYPVYHSNQLVDGGTGVGGIRPAAFVDIDDYTDFNVGNEIDISWTVDSTSADATLTAVDNASPGEAEFDVGAARITSNQLLADSIITCINDSTSITLAGIKGESERSVDTAYFIADAPATWTVFDVTVTGPDPISYKVSDNTLHDSPNLGVVFANLTTNETHFSRANDNGYTWNDDAATPLWIQVTGVGSLPNATVNQHGVIRISDGLTDGVSGDGIISVDLGATGGLEFTGVTPDGTIGIKAAGVINSMLKLGTPGATDPGTGEIFADDIPLTDAAVAITATNVQGALLELDTAVGLNTTHSTSDGTDHSHVGLNDTHRTGDGSDHADVATNTTHSTGDGSDHADVATNTASISDLEDNVIQGGQGIQIDLGGNLSDSTTVVSIELGTTPGLKLDGDVLAVKLKPSGGLGVDSDGIYATDAQGTVKVVEQVTLDSTDVGAAEITLNSTPTTSTTVQLSVVSGIQQQYATDFTVTGTTLSWSGLGLDGLLTSGDELIVWYSSY